MRKAGRRQASQQDIVPVVLRMELKKRKKRNHVQRSKRSGNSLARQGKAVQTFPVDGSAG